MKCTHCGKETDIPFHTCDRSVKMKISDLARKAAQNEILSSALHDAVTHGSYTQSAINEACKPLVEAASAAIGALAEANLHITNEGARALLEMVRHYCEESLLRHHRERGEDKGC